jgi:2-dehydro-3-deoxygluconokinase
VTAEVVSLGEPLVALVACDVGPLELATRFEPHVVGAELNAAIGVARLGHRAAYISRVGDDAPGRAVLRALRAESVDVAHVAVDHAAPTGILLRGRRGGLASEVAYYRSGSAAAGLSPADVEAARTTIAGARRLHVSGITPALSPGARAAVQAAIAIAVGAGVDVSFDVNLRRRLWDDETARRVLMDGIGRASTVLGSAEELCVITGAEDWQAAAETLLALGVGEVVVKRGGEGASLVRAGMPPLDSPARIVEVLDPVGAGDAFSAGYLVGRLRGLDDPAVLALANACGALAVASIGDTTGLPAAGELEHLAVGAEEARR